MQAQTGLLLDPYFSGTKIGWAMENWPQLAEAGDRLAIGTIDSWLVWKLTGGLHVTDATNASRTLLMGRVSGALGRWPDRRCSVRRATPEIVDSAGRFGETAALGAAIPICGIAGDQQAAAIGQCAFARRDQGDLRHRCLRAHQRGHRPRARATGCCRPCSRRSAAAAPMRSRDRCSSPAASCNGCATRVGLVGSACETEAIARSVPDNGGVYLVPALCRACSAP